MKKANRKQKTFKEIQVFNTMKPTLTQNERNFSP